MTTKTAILTSHGQPSAPEPPEHALAALAAEVAVHLPSWDIRSATLANPGRLDAVMTDGAIIYPFFMARGWFTAKVLPKRLSGRVYTMACPFGLDSSLPELTAAALQDAQREAGWADAPLSVLLAAHGSARGPKAAEAAEAFATHLRALLPSAQISPAFVEQAPGIDTIARTLPRRTLCLPFFAQAGDHVREDIPEALNSAAFAGQVLPVVGALPGTPALIASAIAAADSE